MAITQLSAFLENTSGTLYDALCAVTEAGVNIRALITDCTALRMIIVSDIEKTKQALSADTIVKETPVIAALMSDRAGALKDILSVLKSENINIEYVYAFTGTSQGEAYVVLRVDEVEKAEKILKENNIKTLSDEEFLN